MERPVLGLGMDDQTKREPFFGPWPNIVAFALFIGIGVLLRLIAHR